MNSFTDEMIKKAKSAKSAEELLTAAKEFEIDMTKEEAEKYFEQLNPKLCELEDEDVEAVAAGSICSDDTDDDGDKIKYTSKFG